MCYASDSVELATATCAMCSVMARLYQKPHAVCPHRASMGVCHNRANHPRADYVFYRNAEIANFQNCGYCKWADRHPNLSQRELWENPGWPGCCRPPSSTDYKQYISGADWPAVSHIFKIARVASTDGASSGRDDQRPSPRSKPAPSWPATQPGRSNSPIRRPDPIPRSGSPLSIGRHVERPGTPPTVTYQRERSAIRISNPSVTRAGSSDEPTTPPARRSKELTSSPAARLADKKRTSSPGRQRSSSSELEVVAPTPRRNNPVPPPNSLPIREDQSPSPKARSQPIPRVGPRFSLDGDTRRPPKDKRAIDANDLIIDRSSLTSEALQRVNDLQRAMQGMRLTSAPSVSSSSSGSETSTSSRRHSSTTTGGSSDFTDFLSDDSDYELQRQAEERAAQLQKVREERADEREFRDAQIGLEELGLTESMDLTPHRQPTLTARHGIPPLYSGVRYR